MTDQTPISFEPSSIVPTGYFHEQEMLANLVPDQPNNQSQAASSSGDNQLSLQIDDDGYVKNPANFCAESGEHSVEPWIKAVQEERSHRVWLHHIVTSGKLKDPRFRSGKDLNDYLTTLGLGTEQLLFSQMFSDLRRRLLATESPERLLNGQLTEAQCQALLDEIEERQNGSSWNIRLLSQLNRPATTPYDVSVGVREVRNLLKEFSHHILSNEQELLRHLTRAARSESAVDGSAGGHKVIINGVLYKLGKELPIDNQVASQQIRQNMKVLHHDLKGANLLVQNWNGSDRELRDKIRVPMVALVTHWGFRSLAVAWLPINLGLNTLVEGSSTMGRSREIREAPSLSDLLIPEEDRRVAMAITAAARDLRLAAHPVIDRQSRQKTVRFAVDAEIHRTRTGELYIIDFSRICPPFDSQRMLTHFLRPELWIPWSATKCKNFGVSGDAKSCFCICRDQPDQSCGYCGDIDSLKHHAQTNIIPGLLAKGVLSDKLDEPDELLRVLHEHGINIWMLPWVWHAWWNRDSDRDEVQQVPLVFLIIREMLCRAFKEYSWTTYVLALSKTIESDPTLTIERQANECFKLLQPSSSNKLWDITCEKFWLLDKNDGTCRNLLNRLLADEHHLKRTVQRWQQLVIWHDASSISQQPAIIRTMTPPHCRALDTEEKRFAFVATMRATLRSMGYPEQKRSEHVPYLKNLMRIYESCCDMKKIDKSCQLTEIIRQIYREELRLFDPDLASADEECINMTVRQRLGELNHRQELASSFSEATYFGNDGCLARVVIDLVSHHIESACLLHRQARYHDALAVAHAALHLVESSAGRVGLGKTADDLIRDCLFAISAILSSLGQFVVADRLLNRFNYACATLLTCKAALKRALGQYDLAIDYINKCILIQSQKLGQYHPDYAFSFCNLANIYELKGEFENAKLRNSQCLTLLNNIPDSSELFKIPALRSLANLEELNENYDLAKTLHLQCLEIQLRELNNLHPEYAISLVKLAIVLELSGDLRGAERRYQEAKTIQEKVLGNNHPDISISLANLADVYKSQDKLNDAKNLYKRCIRSHKEKGLKLHPRYPMLLSKLAHVHQLMENRTKAIKLYQKCCLIQKRIKGKSHPDYAACLIDLANAHNTNPNRAELVLKKSIKIQKNTLGKLHPDYASTLENLANLLESREHPEINKILSLRKRCSRIRRQSLGKKHSKYALSLSNLAGVYMAKEKLDKAERLYQKCIQIQRKVLGENHLEYAISLSNLGMVYLRQDRRRDALQLQQSCVLIMLDASRPNPLIWTALERLHTVKMWIKFTER